MAPFIQKQSLAIAQQAPRISKWVDQLTLPTAGTAVTFVFPSTVDHVIITYPSGVNVYARSDGSAAALPAVTKTDGTGSEGIPSGSERQLDQGQAVSFVCDTAATTVSFSSSRAGLW